MKAWRKNCLILSAAIAMACLLATGSSHAQPRFSAHDTTIRSMAFDQRGRMWVATFGRGLWVIGDSDIRKFYDESTKQPYPMINNLLFDGQHLWVATAGGGCLKLNTLTDRFEEIGQQKGFEKLHALVRTTTGKVLIGSVGSGTAFLEGNSWKPVKESQPVNLSWVNCIVEWQNRLWLGTSTGLYSNEIDIANWKPRYEQLNRGVNHLAISDDKLLIATTRHGLYGLSPGAEPRKVPGIDGQIYFILASASGTLLLGEHKTGKIDEAMASHSMVSVASGKSAVTDDKNRFFIGTTDGKIYMSENGTEFKLKYFFSDNGLEEQK